MMKIPYGKTRTYGAIAKRLEVAARAVGTACGRNPIPVIIPCHRVVGASGLGGYSGRRRIEDQNGKLLRSKAAHQYADLFADA